MSGRKKHAEHVNLERWLVSYADFITLMFAFFVIMYAISRADMAKFKAASESLKKAFGSGEVHMGGAGSKVAPFDDDTPRGGTMADAPVGKTNVRTYENVELKRVADIIEESVSFELGTKDLGEKMQFIYDPRGLVVRLSAKGFYDPGQAEVRADALPVLNQIGKILATTTRNIRVEGHTDLGRPQGTAFASNWELSTARAAWLVRYLIENFQLDPRRLEAAGYAEFHPVAPNDTEANRSRNRRVEILVLGK